MFNYGQDFNESLPAPQQNNVNQSKKIKDYFRAGFKLHTHIP